MIFTPNDPRPLMKLNVDFRTIKGDKFNKVDGSKPTQQLLNLLKDPDKGGGYIFEFDNVGNGDSCPDFVDNHEEISCGQIESLYYFCLYYSTIGSHVCMLPLSLFGSTLFLSSSISEACFGQLIMGNTCNAILEFLRDISCLLRWLF
ncbi:uncharacterized protein [Lolium perenne]|uniref:uncharacterized protein n=1 Tax=Lolium perenne TaxID=4522 RepID=UPI0021F504DA|nr:uncharacterized protein LOC127295421 isoform X1 [Lolium perenne]XP_051181329.1 uncharacterized protein LOC127295421 isoform X1 [Lolium perenne]XP_051181330.1 uncharacterized protein LOC127295421 isoform X1 [Lolium perenne]